MISLGRGSAQARHGLACICYKGILMIDIPTVFILGAGASVPYGYSTAANLRASIISDFRNRYQVFLRENKIDEPTINKFLLGVPEFVDA